jgi:ribonuclease BN (tRNA processing enzyme)
VKVILLPSSVSDRPESQAQFLTTYLINDAVAIDAGSLGLYGSAQEQAAVKHILLSHSHIDHLASLPIFVENAYEAQRDCVTVYGSEAVLECLRRDIFNDRVWPDFLSLSRPEAPFLRLERLESGQVVELEGLRITAVAVNHVVPTLGFVVEDRASAVAIVSDTGPTDAIWERANAAAHLKAAFLEATFPDTLAELAEEARHLTPTLFAREVQKLKRPAAIIAVHLKARYRAEVLDELARLAIPGLEIGQFGKNYHF